jgi:hypothetical protein
MTNWSKTILTVRRDLKVATSRGLIGPRLAWSSDEIRPDAQRNQSRRKRYVEFRELEAETDLEAGALMGPALPVCLMQHEIRRVGVYTEGRELVSVHLLRTAWVEPCHEIVEAAELHPHLGFEMVYYTFEDDRCGAAVIRGEDVSGHLETDLSAVETARDLLNQAEQAEMPDYFVDWQWFMIIQARRLAGLRPGQAINPPRLEQVAEPDPPRPGAEEEPPSDELSSWPYGPIPF